MPLLTKISRVSYKHIYYDLQVPHVLVEKISVSEMCESDYKNLMIC